MVARHCGYRPLEINASDDRTAATLVARIDDAVQMQAVLGSGRPNCVIIDEIDGAAGARPPAGLPSSTQLADMRARLDQQRLHLDLYLPCQASAAPLKCTVISLLESLPVLKVPELVMVLQRRRL